MTKTFKGKLKKLATKCDFIKQAIKHNFTIEKARAMYPFNYDGDHVALQIFRHDKPVKMYICVRNDGHILQKRKFNLDDNLR